MVPFAGLTQAIKYVTEKFPTDWSAEVTQIVAAVIASALALSASLHLPLGLNQIVILLVNQLGPALTAVLLTAGSYAAHDAAAVLQGIVSLLRAKFPRT